VEKVSKRFAQLEERLRQEERNSPTWKVIQSSKEDSWWSFTVKQILLFVWCWYKRHFLAIYSDDNAILRSLNKELGGILLKSCSVRPENVWMKWNFSL
jgi:hypothetical protein